MRSLAVIAVIVAALISAAPSGAAVKRLRADLRGGQEVSGGDANGRGTAKLRLNRAARRVCFDIRVHDISEVVAAHIHRGRRGHDGPIRVELIGAPQGDEDHFTGCANGVSRRLIRRINRHPRRFYVNVHTVDFPGGAIRGQLHRPAASSIY
jgi:hypothetical protein